MSAIQDVQFQPGESDALRTQKLRVVVDEVMRLANRRTPSAAAALAAGAPAGAQYVVAAADSGLTAERVLTGSGGVGVDTSAAGVVTVGIAAGALGLDRLAAMAPGIVGRSDAAGTPERLVVGAGLVLAAGVLSATGAVASRVLTAGDGLIGGGDLSVDRAFAVGAGAGIVVNADDVALTPASLASLGLADTAVQPSRAIVSGPGLSGGGDLGADRTLAVGAGTGIAVGADDVSLDAAAIAGIALAYTAVQPARSLAAGAGLTGGGDLSADRTFNVGAGTGITVNADDVALSADTQTEMRSFHRVFLLMGA